MRSLFSRLYRRGERPDRSQLEDYLTEVLGSVVDRLDGEAKRCFVHSLIDRSERARFDAVFPSLEEATLATQVVLDVSGDWKRPDMVLRIRDRDVLVIESKIGAPIARHTDRTASLVEGGSEVVTRSQLDTYATWIVRRNCGQNDAWPGAVVLLTAWTPPPTGFPSNGNGAVGSVRTWSWVATRMVENARSQNPVALALSRDLVSFLKEKNVLDRHFDSRDLAAFTLYSASEEALRHTMRTVTRAVVETYKGLGSYSDHNVGIDGSIGFYQGFVYLNRSLQPKGARLWIGIGLCAHLGPAFDEGFAESVVGKEPFFMVYFGDDEQKARAAEQVSAIPDGWVEMKERPALITTKAVREFPSDPDRRVEELKSWACDQVGRLINVMKNYLSKDP